MHVVPNKQLLMAHYTVICTCITSLLGARNFVEHHCISFCSADACRQICPNDTCIGILVEVIGTAIIRKHTKHVSNMLTCRLDKADGVGCCVMSYE